MTSGEFKKYAEATLSHTHDRQEIRMLIKCMLEDFAGIGFGKVPADEPLELQQIQQLTRALERLKSGEPYQYITGRQLFAGHWLVVGPDVLIPRPETEELFYLLVQWLNDRGIQPKTIVDHCTGSGCLAVSLKKVFTNAKVIGTDVSKAALAIAQSNADLLGAEVQFIEMDILKDGFAERLPHTVDLIVSNPPYVCPSEAKTMRPEVLHHEPHLALFVPANDPLVFYRQILEAHYHILTDRGLMAFEINPLFSEDVHRLASAYYRSDVIDDLSGKKRFLFAYK
ncbi:MAG: peptide chain release factor N(5)-glutamine methyltransferase [Thermaurantimonas sp.]